MPEANVSQHFAEANRFEQAYDPASAQGAAVACKIAPASADRSAGAVNLRAVSEVMSKMAIMRPSTLIFQDRPPLAKELFADSPRFVHDVSGYCSQRLFKVTLCLFRSHVPWNP